MLDRSEPPHSDSGEPPGADPELERFLRRVFPKLRTAMTKFQVPVEDADDVLQQALLALVYQWGTINNPEAWLVGTVRNKCRLYWRDRRRRLYETVDDTILEWIADNADPSAEDSDVIHDLAALVSRLPRRCRDILRLRYGLGYTPPEVAELLGYQSSSMSKVTSRCLAALVQQMVRRGFCQPVDLVGGLDSQSID